jgi:hypothetical protein
MGPGGQGGQSLRISLDTPNALPAELHPALPKPVVVEPEDRPDAPGEAGAGATVIGFAGLKVLPPGCPAIVGAVMLAGLPLAVGPTGTVAIFGDLPSCSETAGPTPIVPVVSVPPAFAVPPALGRAAGDCVEGAVVEPIGCASDDAGVNAIRPTVTRITMLLFMLEVLQIRNKETELDSDRFGLAPWLPIPSACGDVSAHSRTCAVSVTPASSHAARPRQPTRSGSKAPQTSAAWARPRCSTAGVRGAALLPGANQFAHQAVRPTDPIVAPAFTSI